MLSVLAGDGWYGVEGEVRKVLVNCKLLLFEFLLSSLLYTPEGLGPNHDPS